MFGRGDDNTTHTFRCFGAMRKHFALLELEIGVVAVLSPFTLHAILAIRRTKPMHACVRAISSSVESILIIIAQTENIHNT